MKRNENIQCCQSISKCQQSESYEMTKEVMKALENILNENEEISISVMKKYVRNGAERKKAKCEKY